MIDSQYVPPVADEEWLARFATQSGHYRKNNYSVKPDLFIPPLSGELSVTRFRETTEDEIWAIGHSVVAAVTPPKKLHGLAKIQTIECNSIGLNVKAAPILPDNPNHADIVGWPSAKEDRKALALKLAASAGRLIQTPL